MGKGHRSAVCGVLLAIAGMAASPVMAQDQSAMGTGAPVADGAPIAATPPPDLQTQQQAMPAPAGRMSIAEKAAAVAGAVAAGAVALKGLSALFKSGKKSATAPVTAATSPID